MSAPVGTEAGKILPLRQSSQPLSSYGVSVEQVERWHILQIKPKKKKYIHTHIFCFVFITFPWMSGQKPGSALKKLVMSCLCHFET